MVVGYHHFRKPPYTCTSETNLSLPFKAKECCHPPEGVFGQWKASPLDPNSLSGVYGGVILGRF